MTYEQFLKQLRRIGLQIMFASGFMIVASFVFTRPIDRMTWINDFFTPCALLFLIGLCIYPIKTED